MVYYFTKKNFSFDSSYLKYPLYLYKKDVLYAINIKERDVIVIG